MKTVCTLQRKPIPRSLYGIGRNLVTLFEGLLDGVRVDDASHDLSQQVFIRLLEARAERRQGLGAFGQVVDIVDAKQRHANVLCRIRLRFRLLVSGSLLSWDERVTPSGKVLPRST